VDGELNEAGIEQRKRAGIIRAFRFAFAGLWYFLRTQRNARIEIAIATGVCGLAAWLRIGRIEWAILVLTIAVVLIAEGFNTAIELAVDLSMPRLHPLARTCKDVAAGMVLIAALASVAVGLVVLGPPLWCRLVK
jgi:diacylglycerol kinase